MSLAGADAAGVGEKLLMIAIDAMSLPFARAHLDQLPVLRSLIEEGKLRDLTSPAVHASASVWPTFATGEGPGVHGHYFPCQWDATAMRFARTTSADWAGKLDFEPFWRGVARAGAPVIVFDAGVPIDPSNAPCLEVSNWSYQSSGAAVSSNPALLRKIRRRFGRRPIGKEVPVPKSLERSRRIRDSLIAALRRKTDAALWLSERSDWRLFLLGYYEIHRAGHNLLVVDGDFGSRADRGALLDVYQALDAELGRLFQQLRDEQTTLLLFALHGMAPNWAQDHFLDETLARLNGAYAVSRGGKAPPGKRRNFVSHLRDRVPYDVQYSLAHLLGEHVQDWVVNRTFTGGLDWSMTPSFRMVSGGEGYIRFNIKGRERQGFLSGDEVAPYKNWLIERLLEIRITALDKPLIAEVLDGHDLFAGERSDYLPDLILRYAPEEPARAVRSPVIGEVTAHLDTGRGGNHTGDAFLIAAGPGTGAPGLDAVHDIGDIGRFAQAFFAAPPGAPETSRPASAGAFAAPNPSSLRL